VDSVSAALRAVALQKWLAIAALVSCVAVPVIAIALLIRWTENRGSGARVAIWTTGCGALLVYAAAACLFAVCGGGEIGESGKNRLARAYGTPIVAGLERYRQVTGAYPDSLSELVPRFVARSQLAAPTASVLEYPFEYHRRGGTFELVVRYVGPGMNECRFTPGRIWQCSGYF